jgi:hypothetical protein
MPKVLWIHEEHSTYADGALTRHPPSFLPADLDRSGLVDITSIGDAFRVYLDPVTGKVHDGAVYYEQHLKEQNDG